MGGAVSEEENEIRYTDNLCAVLCPIHEYNWLFVRDVYRIWRASVSNLVSNDYCHLHRFSDYVPCFVPQTLLLKQVKNRTPKTGERNE